MIAIVYASAKAGSSADVIGADGGFAPPAFPATTISGAISG